MAQLFVDPGPFGGAITGSAPAGDAVTITHGGTTYGPVTVGTDGRWSVPFNKPPDEYAVDILLTASDYKELDNYTITIT
jgi:hypothetical protein